MQLKEVFSEYELIELGEINKLDILNDTKEILVKEYIIHKLKCKLKYEIASNNELINSLDNLEKENKRLQSYEVLQKIRSGETE